jgi:hypothetical protein
VDVDTGEWAAVVVAGASVIAVVVLAVMLLAVIRTLTTVREAVETFRRDTLATVGELRTAARQANVELERVDTLLGTAESIGSTVDSASRLAYLALSNPIIKAVAFASGTGRAARRLRRARADRG